MVVIDSVLARNNGRNGRHRIRKPCKSGEIKVLKMTPRLRSLLWARCQNKQPYDLVFPGPRGGPIDDHSFAQRVWKKVVTSLGIPYRVFYACRHTFISHGIDQGIPITDLAKLVGHTNPTTISRHYAHSLKRLPDLPVILPVADSEPDDLAGTSAQNQELQPTYTKEHNQTGLG